MSDQVTAPSRARRLIARRMTESVQSTPHFYLRRRLRADHLRDRHRALRDAGVETTLNDLVVAAAGRALVEVPEMNVAWTEEGIRQFADSNVAIAIDSARGLTAPTLASAGTCDERTLAEARARLVAKAHAGQLEQIDFAPAALTVSNLGMFGIDEFAGIISPGQSSILAVGVIADVPMVVAGRVRSVPAVSCTLSVDHRPLDGGIAARWFAAFASHVQGTGEHTR